MPAKEPDRHVTFESCFNFRDLGGYRTVDGRWVRRRTVYRSGSLHRMTQGDLDIAVGLDLCTIIDLRSTSEVTRRGQPALTARHLPIFEEDALPFKPAEPGDPEPIPGEDYLAIATAGAGSIAAVLRCIAAEDHPVVFHCAAGKDRTGIIAALLLSCLGVPKDTVIADYELSDLSVDLAVSWAQANDPEWAAEIAAVPTWLLRSPGHVMAAFLEMLDDRHGSVEGYLADIGVGESVVHTLRARLLEPTNSQSMEAAAEM